MPLFLLLFIYFLDMFAPLLGDDREKEQMTCSKLRASITALQVGLHRKFCNPLTHRDSLYNTHQPREGGLLYLTHISWRHQRLGHHDANGVQAR